MILYFTGTGNSRYLAGALSESLGDVCVDSRPYLRRNEAGAFSSELPYVFVFPTYAWRMPHVFEAFLRRSAFSGSRRAYFVMACGADIGSAGAHLETLCAALGLEYCGVLPVVMPDNYVVMYDVTPKDEETAILRKGEAQVISAAERIRAGEPFPARRITAVDKAKSGMMNAAFFRLMVKTKKFRATDACVSCGQCAQTCPMNNITLSGGRPVWGGACTHCMACISLCPKGAIEYGRGTVGRRRYRCPERMENQE